MLTIETVLAVRDSFRDLPPEYQDAEETARNLLPLDSSERTVAALADVLDYDVPRDAARAMAKRAVTYADMDTLALVPEEE